MPPSTFFEQFSCSTLTSTQLGSELSPAWVNLYTDALTTARVLAAESAKSAVIVNAYIITSSPPLRTEWRSLYGRLRVAHLYGDASVLADLISRARWAEFRRLCAMLGVRPQLLELPSGVQTTSCTGWSSRTCGSALTSPPQLGESSTLI